MRGLFAAAIAGSLMLSCIAPKGTTLNPLLGPGESLTPLPQPPYVGLGKYTKLSEVTDPLRVPGVPYVSFLRVRQPAGVALPSLGADGFVYALAGTHAVLSEERERGQTIVEGSAAYVASDRVHPAAIYPQEWYFVALRPIASRTEPPPASAAAVYSSGDVASVAPGTAAVQQLGLISMAAGGRTSSHTHGGTEAFYVMIGSVELRLNDGTRRTIASGGGAFVRPGVVMQLMVVGSEPVQILTYFLTPADKPWQTNLETLP